MRAPKESIFICYRRADSLDITGRIDDELRRAFGHAAIYRDLDNIPLGVDFRVHIQQCLQRCRIGLIVIGSEWEGPREASRSRLEQKADHVRIECETMLKLGRMTLIPCFVRGRESLDERAVPESLRSLCFINGMRIRSDRDFHRDITALVANCEHMLKEKSAPATPARIWTRGNWVGLSIGLVLLVVFKLSPTAPDKGGPAGAGTDAGRESAMPAPTPKPAQIPAQVATSPVSNAKVYHVKAGDTLQNIAASLNVSVTELQFVNTPKELAALRPGQIINVPVRKSGPFPSPMRVR